MKKTFLSILCFGLSICSYSQDIVLPEGNQIRRNLGDNFTYQNRPMCFYGIGWQSDTWNVTGNSLWMSAFGGIKFFTEKGYSMGINSRGNVGIGTDTPTAKLDVNGNTKVTGNLYIGKKETSTGVTEVTRINIVPYAHTAGTWDIISRDDLSSAFLDIAYGSFKNLFVIQHEGKIGIGVKNPQSKLDVAGSIKATGAYINGIVHTNEVKVEATTWSDFVFDKDYKLPALDEVENHINEHKHLPDIPSEAEVKENGVSLGEMQAKLLQKIEELTLYVIQQDKTIKNLEDKVQKLEAK